MAASNKVSVFWFRRDLRLSDNAALYHALKTANPVIPVFIYDKNILDDLEDRKDARVTFIHRCISELQEKLAEEGTSLSIFHDTPIHAFKEIVEKYPVASVYTNTDYEPYATKRDEEIASFLHKKGISFHSYKDQVIFDKQEVVKDNDKPYTVFTPYSRKWKAALTDFHLKAYPVKKYFSNFLKRHPERMPSLSSLGFTASDTDFPSARLNHETAKHYDKTRDLPGIKGTTRMSLHLRFGTVSIRKLATDAKELNETLLNELIWRDFYHMILWHFPKVVNDAFKPDYDNIKWRYAEKEFERWCNGTTGYP